jgi:oligopeptidase A
MSHPFLTQDFQLRWSTLTPAPIQNDIREALSRAQMKLDAVIEQDRGKMSFKSVILDLDEATRELNETWGLVQHLDSLCNSPALREAHNAMLPEVSSFFAKIPLNEHLWDLLVTYSKTEDARQLSPVRQRALRECMEGFIEAGADLPPDKKKRMEEIESELSQATQKYSENVLDSTNKWELLIDEPTKLEGLPHSAIDAALADAAAKGLGTEEKLHAQSSLHDPGA